MKKPRIFLSYSTGDYKKHVGKIYSSLSKVSTIWIDRVGIRGGDSLLKKIGEAIENVDYVVAILTRKSVSSEWVRTELEIAMTREINRKRVFVIPVVLENCKIPSFISHKRYINFVRTDFRNAITELKGSLTPTEVVHEGVLIKAGLVEPTGIAILKNKIFVCDHSSGTLSRYNLFGRLEKDVADLNQPHHIMVKKNLLYVCDTTNNRISIYNYELKKCKKIVCPNMSRPHGIAMINENKFVIATADRHSILLIKNNGAKEYFRTNDGKKFHFPCGIFLHKDRIFLADTFNHRILVLSKNLKTVASFGSRGSGDKQFHCPVSLCFFNNYIFISDETNRRLQLWKEVKSNVFVWRKSNIAPLIKSPFGIAIEGEKLYIADRKGGNLASMKVTDIIN